MDWLGGGLGLLGSLFSGGMNYKMMKDQQQFIREQRADQYQVAADDLEKAGLNRIIAMGSPAPTLAGSMAKWDNIGQSAVTSASQAATVKQQGKKIQADVDKLATELTLLEKDVPVAEMQAAIAKKVQKIFDEYGDTVIDGIIDAIIDSEGSIDVELPSEDVIKERAIEVIINNFSNPFDWENQVPGVWPNYLMHYFGGSNE
mgnify:CR=1 FL=1